MTCGEAAAARGLRRNSKRRKMSMQGAVSANDHHGIDLFWVAGNTDDPLAGAGTLKPAEITSGSPESQNGRGLHGSDEGIRNLLAR